MAEFPAPKEGIALTHLIVSDDVERSRRFYTNVLGGDAVREGEPTIVALANGWVIINRRRDRSFGALVAREPNVATASNLG